jgi:serine/threonine-protein kinase
VSLDREDNTSGKPPVSIHPRDRSIEPTPELTAAMDDLGVVRAEDLDVGEVIGEGATSVVRAAVDRRSGRSLALKIFTSDDHDQLVRFLREVKVQARIQHPHVCRVHGSGLYDRHPFLALELIDGEPLGLLFMELDLSDRLRVIVQAARGLAAAHEAGLVHRDVNPNNILVEQKDGLRAVLSDFGTAHQFGNTMTATGTIIGTPEFMSPEQVAASVKADARADVYGLGATLYYVLAGKPPYSGSPAAVLAAILAKDPKPLPPSVPASLRRIVEKSMDRDRRYRYPTAAALADDLDRFLTGKEVRARPRSQFRKKLARHRGVLLSLAAVVVVMLGAAVSAAVIAVRRAGETEATRAFIKKGALIDDALRQLALLPLHDTRTDRALIEQQLSAIASTLPKRRGPARQAALLALGRGELGLDHTASALAHLEEAHQLGETPETALHYGLALGAAYREALATVEKQTEEGKAALAAAQATYRDPALRLLHVALEERPEAAEWLRAQVAFFEERDDEAMIDAKAALARQPWLFEAYRLRGEVELRRARTRWEAGDLDGSRAALDRAGPELAAAMHIAGSDAGTRISECTRLSTWVRTLYDQSRLRDDSFGPSQAACQAALQAGGGAWPSQVAFAGLLKVQGRYEVEHGKGGEPTYRRAVELLEGAAAGRPSDPDILLSLSGAQGVLGGLLGQHGNAGARAELNAAVKSVDRALELTPKSWSGRNLLVQTLLDRAGLPHNRDAGPDLARAAKVADALANERPESMRAQNGLGTLLDALAVWQAGHGRNPRETWERGAVADEAVQRISPTTDYGFINGCNTVLHRASFLWDAGEDPHPDLVRAEKACRRSIAVDDHYFETPNALASVLTLRARVDATAPLDEARTLLAKGRTINPQYDGFDSTEVQIALVRAERDAQRDPRPALADAMRAIAKGRAHNAGAEWLDDATAEVTRAEVEWRQAHGMPFADLAATGLAAAKRSADGGYARSLVHAGAIALAQARAASADQQSQRAREALALLDRAVAENANLTHLAAPLREAARALIH